MSESLLVTVDAEKRVTLGALAGHESYIVRAGPGGKIILVPAVVTPATRARGGYEPAREGDGG